MSSFLAVSKNVDCLGQRLCDAHDGIGLGRRKTARAAQHDIREGAGQSLRCGADDLGEFDGGSSRQTFPRGTDQVKIRMERNSENALATEQIGDLSGHTRLLLSSKTTSPPARPEKARRARRLPNTRSAGWKLRGNRGAANPPVPSA